MHYKKIMLNWKVLKAEGSKIKNIYETIKAQQCLLKIFWNVKIVCTNNEMMLSNVSWIFGKLINIEKVVY